MYLPKHFEQQNHEALCDLIRNRPLATLVTNTSSGLCANHIPLRLMESSSDGVVLQVLMIALMEPFEDRHNGATPGSA